MKALVTIIWLFALACTCTAQPFGALTAVSTQSTPGIALNWVSGPSGTVIINRAPLGFTPVPIAMTSGTTYTDMTGAANTFYSYSVSQASTQSNLATAVISDMTVPFVCPFVPPVDPLLLGVDRTESFQAPDGTQVSFTIEAPRITPASMTIVQNPCNGAGGCDDITNYFANLATIKAAGKGGILHLNTGTYVSVNPAPSGNISIVSNPDVIIEGDPLVNGVTTTNWVFSNVNATTLANGLAIIGNRNLVRNIGFDWNIPNAIPGVVTTVGGVQRLTVNNPAFYVPDPTHPPTVFSMTGYNTTNGTFIQQSGARAGIGGTFNTNFAMDGLYYYALPAGTWFPENTQAIGWVKTGVVIQIANATNISFEHVRIYGGGGVGISAVSTGSVTGDIRLTDVKMVKKPASLLSPGEPARFVSVFGDNDLNNTTGGVLIENSEFSFMNDDLFAIAGGFGQQLTSIVSSTEFTYQSASQPFLHPQSSLDVFRFYDPVTLAYLGTSAAASWTQTFNAGLWTLDVTLATPIPALTPFVGATGTGVPFASNQGWGNPAVVLRNNCGHDAIGRFTASSSTYSLVTGNTLGNLYFGPIVWFWAPTFLQQVGGSGLILSNNNIVGVGYGIADTDWLGNSTKGMMTGVPSAAIDLEVIDPLGFDASAFVTGTGKILTGFEIYGNFISNTNGLAVFVGGANNVGLVDNKIVDANQVAFQAGYNAAFCGTMSLGLSSLGTNPVCLAKVAAQGSIMVTSSKNVDTSSTPNTFSGTSAGLFIDTPTVRNDNIIGLIH